MQYKIKKGDTLSSISRNLGVSVKDLAKANKIKDVNKIQAGASLIIPQPKKKKSSAVEKVIPQSKIDEFNEGFIRGASSVPTSVIKGIKSIVPESVGKGATETIKSVGRGVKSIVPESVGKGATETIFGAAPVKDESVGRGVKKVIPDIKKYTIQKGDNLYDIAQANLLNTDQLMFANPEIRDASKINAGQTINIPQFNIEGKKEFQNRINLPAEQPQERFLPSNIRQLGYDIFRRQSPNFLKSFQGEDVDFTEGDLTPEEYRILQKIVTQKLREGKTSLGYDDYGTGKGDVGDTSFFGLKKIYNKFNDPAYALKTLLGGANITTNERGEVVITDRYNFNEADPQGLMDYAQKAAIVASNPAYQIPRQAGSIFGSNPGEGSRIRLNLGKLNWRAAQGGQIRHNFNQGGLIGYANGGNMNNEETKITDAQVEELAAFVASKKIVPPLWSMARLKNTWSMLVKDNPNPLIDSYENRGGKFLNSLIRGTSNYDIGKKNQKLLFEVSTLSPVNRNPMSLSPYQLKGQHYLNDPPYNLYDDKSNEELGAWFKDMQRAKADMSESNFMEYSAKKRKDLAKDTIPGVVAHLIHSGEAPTLDWDDRGKKSFNEYLLEELNLQSRYGFNPDVPEYLGQKTGYKYNPAKDQERYITTPASTGEHGVIPESTTDRLAGFSPHEESGYLSGPEGLFYNPEIEQFLTRTPTYGPRPSLEGYQYDPRTKNIISKLYPDYGRGLYQGGLTGYAQGGNTNIRQQTQNVANQGRYGDSMLLHVNPAEVKGLAQTMPITINPQTGQPEAWLPFLAPILGSMAGSAFLTGAGATAATAAGAAATTGLSSALASGIGAGLATYAQTGGSGSKALMSALGGYGAGKAAELAGSLAAKDAAIAQATTGAEKIGFDTVQSANTLPNMQTQLFQNVPPGPQASVVLGPQVAGFDPSKITQQTLDNMIKTTGGYTDAGQVLADQTVSGLQEGIARAGTRASEEFIKSKPTMFESLGQAFKGGYGEGFGNLAEGATSFGAYAPMAVGFGGSSVMHSQDLFEQQMRELEMEDEERRRAMYARSPEPTLYSASGGMTQFQDGGDTDYGYESKKQVYAPTKTQYAVNPNFMAGFAPETMYFRPDTINAPTTSLRGGVLPTLGPDTYTGTKGGYDYEGSFDADGNYIPGTAQGVQIAPQTTIDPYAAFTGSAPLGLIESAYDPYPVEPLTMSPIDDTSNYGGTNGNEYYQGYPDFDFSLYNATDSAGNPSTSSPYGPYDAKAVQDIRDHYKEYFFDYDDIQDFYRDEVQDVYDRKAGGITKYANQGQTEMISPPVDDFRQDPMTDPLIQEVTMFILGESDNEQAVNEFVNKYGVEAFTALREQILQSLVPGAQTEGLVEGVGNGGMDDDIMGTIGGKEKIAVSQDEFIVPADVVSGIGDGSSNAGAKELYAMMDRVREERTGTTKQPTMLANSGGILPA